MEHLADAVLDYYWFLAFSTAEVADDRVTTKLLEDLVATVEQQFSEAEQQALQLAASRRLASWLRAPDEDGYTASSLLTADQRALLESIAAGHFAGPDPGGVEEI